MRPAAGKPLLSSACGASDLCMAVQSSSLLDLSVYHGIHGSTELICTSQSLHSLSPLVCLTCFGTEASSRAFAFDLLLFRAVSRRLNGLNVRLNYSYTTTTRRCISAENQIACRYYCYLTIERFVELRIHSKGVRSSTIEFDVNLSRLLSCFDRKRSPMHHWMSLPTFTQLELYSVCLASREHED